MNKSEYETAASYWMRKDAGSVKMDKEQLRTAVNEFLSQHNTCALATGSGSFVRCTPLEYTYLNGALYIISEGGMKFKGLADNSAVSVAVFDQYSGFGKLNSMQITGRAEMIGQTEKEYADVLSFKKIPLAAITKLDHPMYMIKIVPSQYEMLCSAFKAQGYDSRQTLAL